MKKILIFIAAIILSVEAFGQTKTNLRIILDSLNNKLNNGIIDHFALKDGNLVAIKANNDTLDHHITIAGREELKNIVIMQIDTVNGSSNNDYVYSKYQIDTMTFSGGLSSGQVAAQINDTIVARLAAAVDGIAVTDTLRSSGKHLFYTQWQTDSLAATISGTSIGDVRDEIADSLNALRTDLKVWDSDTIPLFIFGGGSGVTADTAFFNNDRIAGSFRNSTSDTLVVTSLNGVLKAGTGTETIVANIRWHATFLSGSAVSLNTSGLTITDVEGTGTVDTSFDNNNIPPGARVWCILSGASSGNKPTYMELIMTGYHRNRTY